MSQSQTPDWPTAPILKWHNLLRLDKTLDFFYRIKLLLERFSFSEQAQKCKTATITSIKCNDKKALNDISFGVTSLFSLLQYSVLVLSYLSSQNNIFFWGPFHLTFQDKVLPIEVIISLPSVPEIYEPWRENTCLRDFWQNEFQISLLSYRD